MKKIINLILFLIFLTSGFAYAEKLPPQQYRYKFSQESNPVLYKYLENYQNQLYDAFDTGKFREKEWGISYIYTINKDGSISDFIEYDNLSKPELYVRQVILDNPPPPFPANLEAEKIRIRTSLYKTPYDEKDVEYYAYNSRAYVQVYKGYKEKKNKAKKQ